MLILRLHCHWKPSQNGNVLKIAPCWPLTGNVYTGIIKAAWVLSIFDLKHRTSGSALIHRGDQFMISSVSRRNAQEGIKSHGMQLHSHDIAVTRFWDWNALVQYLSQHGFSMDLARYRLHWWWEGAEPSWFCASLLYQSKLGQLSTLWLCLHCHC